MSRRGELPFLTPELLLRAYAAGIFPMAESADDTSVFWVDPERRGVLPLDQFHVSRSLRKTVRRSTYDVTCDTAFEEVIMGCAERAHGRHETWINEPIRIAVCKLHAMGFAHSVECRRNGVLLGGLYGVSLGAAFFGESMFSRATDASKVALVHLVARLRLAGYRLLDTQFITDHLQNFGAVEISGREYHRRLEDAIKYQAVFPADPPADELHDMLDRVFAKDA